MKTLIKFLLFLLFYYLVNLWVYYKYNSWNLFFHDTILVSTSTIFLVYFFFTTSHILIFISIQYKWYFITLMGKIKITKSIIIKTRQFQTIWRPNKIYELVNIQPLSNTKKEISYYFIFVIFIIYYSLLLYIWE